jgi:two-component system, sensor histidine kinase and response regulator
MTMNRTMTLLLIDDKDTNLFALEQLLEKQDRVFLKATTGREGLKLALDHEVDLIILDVQMPEMDGFEVAQILKSNKRTKDIPIIFASAEKKERQSIIQGFEEGAVDYLPKPLDPELTKAKVSVLLKIRLQNRQLQEKNLALQQADERISLLNVDLQKNLRQLEAANKELESFSYSVSHDLRSPIRAMLGYARIVEEEQTGKLNDAAGRALKIIQDNAQKMNRMIDDLLAFSKLGRQTLQHLYVDMGALVRTVLTDLRQRLPYQPEIVVHDLLPAHADTALLAHVWTNLISNAMKYSSKATQPHIEIGAQAGDNEVQYYVKDNGAGFDMKYADKLFQVFQRLHKPADFEGTGVGLAIVQRIIARHGGRIWAEAKVNEGATFHFTLPVAAPHESPAEVTKRAPQTIGAR